MKNSEHDFYFYFLIETECQKNRKTDVTEERQRGERQREI